jgi:hypothetical protein
MAKNSGRRSQADKYAARFVGTIEPTRKLSAGEQKVWARVLRAWPASQWVGSDSELLTQYCAACVAFDEACRKENLSAMDRAGRLALSYATKLRITPQSRYDARAAGRHAEHGKSNEAAAERLLGGIEAWDTQPEPKPN